MARKLKAMAGVMSDSLETALGWAFCAVAVYVLLFVNLTGDGALWDSLRVVVRDEIPAPILRNVSVWTRVVPQRPVDAGVKAQNRMLLIPDVPEYEFKVPVLAGQAAPAGSGARNSR